MVMGGLSGSVRRRNDSPVLLCRVFVAGQRSRQHDKTVNEGCRRLNCRYSALTMTDERSALLARINAALARIEAQSNATPAPYAQDRDFAHLSARHSALRDEADATLSTLDTLIARLEGKS
jgi:hypothetical protein